MTSKIVTRIGIVLALWVGLAAALFRRWQMEDIDTWRVAAQLIKSYGEDARFIAAKRADALLANGDAEGSHA